MFTDRAFTEEFIDLYRSQSCLWDVESSDYCNKYKKNVSYEILLCKLKEVNPTATTDTVKKKINNLRTSFKREYKKVQDSQLNSGGSELYTPSLWYYNSMLFTVQSDVNWTCTLVQNLQDLNSETQCTVKSECEDFAEEAKPSPVSFPSDASPPQIVSSDSEELSVQSEGQSFRTGTPPAKRKSVGTANSKFKFRYENGYGRRRPLGPGRRVLTGHEDEYQVAGKRIGYQLKTLNEKQKTIAEKLISDIMYYGKLGKLTENAYVECDAIRNVYFPSRRSN